MAYNPSTSSLGKILGESIGQFATNTAQQAIQGVMGHEANLASAAGQAEAERFNQQAMNAANQQNISSMANQYQYNSAQAAQTNDYNAMMWQKSADWNEAMWERQAAFNAEQAQIQREWSERMENTKYQRAIHDMESAGLNPILAVTGGGISSGAGSGSAASVGGASMGSASGVMASGGLLGAESASVGGYQGQAEFTGGLLALLGTAIGQLGSAQQILGALGDTGNELAKGVTDIVFGEETGPKAYKMGSAVVNKWQSETKKNGLNKGTWNTIKDTGKALYNTFIKNTGSKEFQFRSGHAKG